MDSINFVHLIEAASLACILGFTPLGVVSVVDLILHVVQKNSFYCKARAFRAKIDDIVNREWVIVTQCALITVLTFTLFIHFHSYKGEGLWDTFVRLIVTPFFVS